MIRLNTIPKEKYEESSLILDKELKSILPKILRLNLEDFLQDYTGELQVKVSPKAFAITDPEIDYYDMCFDISIDKEDETEFSRLIRNNQLNTQTIKRITGMYQRIFDKQPPSSYDLLSLCNSDEELFNTLVCHYYDVRYHPEKNSISSFDLYSGRLKRQGLLSYFYSSLTKVIDFDDLSYLEIGDIVENSTCKMFNKLRKKIKSDSYLSEILKRKYVNSPFMRLFNNLGFRNMEIQTNEGYISSILAQKSDILNFKIIEKND